MLKKGPGGFRKPFGPQPRDFIVLPERRKRKGRKKDDAGLDPQLANKLLQNLRADGFSRMPEPRVPGKHALNPPIVTIFGAGVSGLTAAHELVDRGFLVQVVEASEDPYSPGRPHVGGMAANQPARVRANVEDLHRELIGAALTPAPKDETKEKAAERRVATWLLKVFAFTRSRWIQTEKPARLHTCIFPEAASEGDDEAAKAKAAEEFKNELLKELAKARLRYRRRWLWDLSVRAVMLDIITGAPPQEPPQPSRPSEDPKVAKAKAMDAARTLFKELDGASSAKIVSVILDYRLASRTVGEELPSEQDLEDCAALVEAALEREFLCFRLVPYTREGFTPEPIAALELHEKWTDTFGADKSLRHACLSIPPAKKRGKGAIQRGQDGVPIAVRSAEAAPDFPHLVWLEIEVVEQRLPGEHGYRFFPSFYRHLDDTMGRIPLYANGVPTGRTVRDNLQPTVFQGIGLSESDRQNMGNVPDDSDPVPEGCRPRTTGTVIELDRQKPRSFEALRDCTDRFVKRLGGTERDSILLLARLAQFVTSSPERRRDQYEQQTWKDFLLAQHFSKAMQFQIQSASQALLAFSASEADARTYGNIAVQMLLDQVRDGSRVDRTLNGPTSDAWLEPWREHLERQGVRFFRGKLAGLEIKRPPNGARKDAPSELVPKIDILLQDRLSPQVLPLLTHDLSQPALQPDFYVLALNVEQSRELVEKLAPQLDEGELAAKAPDLAKLLQFGKAIDGDAERGGAMREMTGIQYYFDARTDIGRGHLYFPYSRWGLSSISQSEFWSARGGFADGYFGLLSVDVCTTGDLQDGTTPEPEDDDLPFLTSLGEGMSQKEGCLQTAQRAFKQIKGRLRAEERVSEPRCYHIDDNLLANHRPDEDGDEDGARGIKAQFLASVVGLDATRPGRNGACVGPNEIQYNLGFGRWALCGTFMATHTRMTTMEAANESARHAVAAILRQLQVNDRDRALAIKVAGQDYQIENLANTTYNWASTKRAYEAPETWNPEDDELDDLDFFRRVDRRLHALKMPHFMEIIKFDEKLRHALQGKELYQDDVPLNRLFGASVAGIDAALTRELGQGYFEREKDKMDGHLKGALKLQHTENTPFTDMNALNSRWNELLTNFSTLIKPA